jgi:L-cysteine S-thiosulfotransferase
MRSFDGLSTNAAAWRGWSWCLWMLCASGIALSVSAQTRPSTTTQLSATQPNARLSGHHFLSPQLQSLQLDASRNPALLWVERGQALWSAQCSTCHGPMAEFNNSASRFPKLDTLGQLLNLDDQIIRCGARNSTTWTLESEPILALSAALHEAGKGRPINVDLEPALQAYYERGKALYNTRLGRINLACTHCHDDKVGAQMRGDVINQAHPTGFPIYRMSWQTLGSIDRRLRACYSGVQAPLPAPGSSALRELELYLKVRAKGIPLEGASIRR